MKKILLIGCGGIGSFLAREINRLILNDQIDLEDIEITVADNDIVEAKNIRYQNFSKENIFSNKAEVISKRYCFSAITKRINNIEQLNGYDFIILAVDNSKARKLVYDYCYDTNSNIPFVDLRAEGRAIAFFTKESDKDELIKKLGENITDEGNSCQLEYELKNGIIQNGNLIIATIGSQLLLNYLRGEKSPKEFILRI